MTIQLHKIQKSGEWKKMRIIDTNDYYFHNCGGSLGIDLKHRKNGKILELYTPEFYEMGIHEYAGDAETIKRIFSVNYIKQNDFSKLFQLRCTQNH